MSKTQITKDTENRAGQAFENHLATILVAHKIPFSKNPRTELKSTPDFLFPGISEYKDKNYPSDHLLMLAVKTSCKDRWRQILHEAARIRRKHLATLEPGISVDQTDEIASHNVQLVIPSPLHNTYSDKQRKALMSLSGFMDLLHKYYGHD